MHHKEEMLAQRNAFMQMNGDVLDLISRYAEDFRKIIIDYEKEFGKPPSAEDLIWISSQHHNHNIRNG